jgi:hypothetical protein
LLSIIYSNKVIEGVYNKQKINNHIYLQLLSLFLNTTKLFSNTLESNEVSLLINLLDLEIIYFQKIYIVSQNEVSCFC